MSALVLFLVKRKVSKRSLKKGEDGLNQHTEAFFSPLDWNEMFRLKNSKETNNSSSISEVWVTGDDVWQITEQQILH